MSADYDYPADYWDEVSDQAKDFINKLLVVEPAKRLTTKQALEHPWLKTLGADAGGELKVGAGLSKYVQQRKKENLTTADQLEF